MQDVDRNETKSFIFFICCEYFEIDVVMSTQCAILGYNKMSVSFEEVFSCTCFTGIM